MLAPGRTPSPCLPQDPESWRALWKEHAPAMRRAALARLGRQADAEDVCQQVFAKLSADPAGTLGSFRGESRLGTWLVAVTLRAADDFARRERRHEDRVRGAAAAPGEVPDALQAASGLEDRSRLLAAVANLPARDRLLLRLLYWDGASHALAARTLKIALGSVTTLQQRALGRLREALSEKP